MGQREVKGSGLVKWYVNSQAMCNALAKKKNQKVAQAVKPLPAGFVCPRSLPYQLNW